MVVYIYSVNFWEVEVGFVNEYVEYLNFMLVWSKDRENDLFKVLVEIWGVFCYVNEF